MSGRAVVILTEPERCELADADSLTQAVLQIQQLNKAGLAASQAFCDHPAAAMKFIEAYAKVFPELQLNGAGLPLPEQLYSIVAEGRITSLSAVPSPEAAKSGEMSQLYPLYVLSLGAPDALMRALKHNTFATSNIKIVEIAPVERPNSDAPAVADAVAHDGRASWHAETSADLRHNEDDGFGPADWAPGDSLKLESAEVNLDHIGVDHKRAEASYERMADESAPPMVAAHPTTVGQPPALAASGDGGTGAPVLGGAGHEGGGAGVPQPVSAAASSAGHESNTLYPPAAAPDSSVGESALTGNSPTTDGATAETSSAAAPNGTGPGADDPPSHGTEGDAAGGEGVHDPSEPVVVATTDPADDGDGQQGTPGHAAGQDSLDAEHDGKAGQGPTPSELSEADGRAPAEMAGRTEALSFREPGGDVTYQPNASFAGGDDVSYQLPHGTGPWGLLGELVARSGDGETVDLEAIFGSLSHPPPASAEPFEDFSFGVRGMHGATSPGAHDAGPPSAAPETPLPAADHHGPDQDDAGHERVPVSHDLDI
jgi:hypothetical protein